MRHLQHSCRRSVVGAVGGYRSSSFSPQPRRAPLRRRLSALLPLRGQPPSLCRFHLKNLKWNFMTLKVTPGHLMVHISTNIGPFGLVQGAKLLIRSCTNALSHLFYRGGATPFRCNSVLCKKLPDLDPFLLFGALKLCQKRAPLSAKRSSLYPHFIPCLC
jgi:hypothetical protein